MGKKGTTSWFSEIKGVFTSTFKHNKNSTPPPSLLVNNVSSEGEKKSWKAEKKGRRLKHGFPKLLFREPSSIEKILGEVDQHNLFIPPHHHHHPTTTTTTQPQSQAEASSGRPPVYPPPPPPRVVVVVHSPPRAAYSPPQTTYPPRAAAASSTSPREIIHPQTAEIITHTTQPQPQPTLQHHHHHHLSATRIQAAYRCYKSRKKLKGLTGLMRLQGVVKDQNVKRQTVNAMKQMQLLVRVQTQIHSLRIQMLDNQPQLKPQTNNNNNNNLSETGDWDDSVITKEKRVARLKKKVEALTNRERAMSYAYSHSHSHSHKQLQKGKPKSGHERDIRSGGYPPYSWWWNSLERQVPPSHTQPPIKLATTASRARLTPDQNSSHKQLDTPMSLRSMASSRTRQQTTTPNRMMMMLKNPKTTRGRRMKDDDSLMSCPPFTVPNYMSPTVSAKAKARPTSNPRDRPTTPGSISSSLSLSLSSSKRRFSFPFTPNSNNHRSPRSVGVDLSVTYVPASLERKPFNRFV